MKNPCTKDCPERNETCHGTCKRYKDFAEYRKKINAKKLEINTIKGYVVTEIDKNKRTKEKRGVRLP